MSKLAHALLALDGRGGREAAGAGDSATSSEYRAHSVVTQTRADSSPIEGEQEHAA